MKSKKASYNLIFTGVGGQGNVFSTQLLGDAFISKGYFVTIGETYGASQRGGSVMSHIRISREKQLSPLIPKGRADIVVATEPVEALRVLALYGNPEVIVLVNTRPIYPVDVLAGDEIYPEVEVVTKTIESLSRKAHFMDATESAIKIGSSIIGSMIMVGALLELQLLPLNHDEFRKVLSRKLDGKRFDLNIQALEQGKKLLIC